ncbi:UDP-glucose 4-epimerase GalE [Duganella qianjiadongensis]|uniref:UDP-glucose 4-epimerase n=1 Tax=Duganella qianjiadongensis TaxID=2692176 RepID=A0ABW9VLX4_9BURK|nr:UDP-glucose 4-epimerase GalE [Duganella qianjiadongensis]MYM40458.1 UDP-glucose 4-epimerase GalE [Duganella qianjiadongensis]
MTSILLTGGAGYIGSHTYVALCEAGYRPIILDDFSNSHPAVLARLEQLTGQPVLHARGDVADVALLRGLLEQHQVQAVIHFAAHKAVGESVAQPLKYFDNNITGLIRLMQAMEQAGCRKLVFSSSATVYGDPASVPITEDFPLQHTSPYGCSKVVAESMIAGLLAAQPAWRAALLRYFNPVGAHPSGSIGEHPQGVPNNLMPYVAQVAGGKRPFLNIWGGDYPTPDGTGLRDYIHVSDLAEGHVAALRHLLDGADSFTVNLGTGRGYSVLEVLKAFSAACGRELPYQIAPRRPGDIAQCYADAGKARQLLGWQARRTLEQMCADTWRWQSSNPEGYQ